MHKKILIFTMATLVLYLSFTLFITHYSMRSSKSSYDPLPTEEFKQITLTNGRGEKLIGWASKTEYAQSVLLLHGIRSDSRSMLQRALFFVTHFTIMWYSLINEPMD